jgi:hypothetical protein
MLAPVRKRQKPRPAQCFQNAEQSLDTKQVKAAYKKIVNVSQAQGLLGAGGAAGGAAAGAAAVPVSFGVAR